ncbi:venom allergen 3-like [Venturia canescens]|uniref:venom allergen 3-like n=1 Tax=Venturia canescens TaxID=32260 RepID=UPI001C9C7A5D|nr:venom allergen 3-like [Venturia canescens]
MAFSLYSLVFVATIAVLAEARNAAYCNLASCDGKQHTLCLFSAENPSKTCGKVQNMGVTKDQIREIVDVHNKYRKLVASGGERRGVSGPQPAGNIGPLTWSPELAVIAQAWANQCQFGHDGCRNTPATKVGQNVAISQVYGQEQKSLSHMISGWYDEVKNFDSNLVRSYQNRGGPVVGHYTQMVWGKTTHVGCGIIDYMNDGPWESRYLVCNYGPAGNFIGQPIY